MGGMDPNAPINGVSLERYAELAAELDGIDDPQAQTAKVGELGVSAGDWNAAKQGWTARMQDPGNMGQIATRYMQLYNAALANKQSQSGGGPVTCSFEDFCAVSAAIQVYGWEGAMKAHGLTQGQWTTLSAHWQNQMNADPMNMGQRRNQLQAQEAQRLQSGGQLRKIQLGQGAPSSNPQAGGAAQPPNTAFNPQAAGAMHAAAGQQVAQGWQAHTAQALNQPGVQGAMKMAGFMDKMGGGDGLVAGRAVMVQWSDGNKYPGTITQDGGNQAQITFSDGRQMWVEKQYLSPK